MALFPLLRSSSFKFDNICFKALRYSDENDEENLSVVPVGVGDLGSLQNLHLILWNWLKRDWRVISRCYEPPWCWCCCRCWRRFCAPSRLSLLASAPFLDVLTTAGIPVMCADESICWIENRISPHWQLHFHHVHCTCTYMLCELLTYRYVLSVMAGKIFPTFLTWCTFVFQISKWSLVNKWPVQNLAYWEHL